MIDPQVEVVRFTNALYQIHHPLSPFLLIKGIMAFLGIPQLLWHEVWSWLHSLSYFKFTFVEQVTRLYNEVLEVSIHISRIFHRGTATAPIAFQANVCLRWYITVLMLSIFHCCILKCWKLSLSKCRALLVKIQTLQEPVHSIKHRDQIAVKTTTDHWSLKFPTDND